MERTHEPVLDRDADVVGLISVFDFGCNDTLGAMTALRRLSRRRSSMRMATGVFDTATQVETWCQHRGVDLADKASGF